MKLLSQFISYAESATGLCLILALFLHILPRIHSDRQFRTSKLATTAITCIVSRAPKADFRLYRKKCFNVVHLIQYNS